MPRYVCTDLQTDWLNNQVCKGWVELSASSTGSFIDAFAITSAQADEISLRIIILWVTAYGYRLVINIIQRRRY